MAVILLNNGTKKTIPKQQGIHLWLVLSSEQEPDNEAQANFLSNVKRVYLNRHDPDCPQSYLDRYQSVFADMDGYLLPVTRKPGW